MVAKPSGSDSSDRAAGDANDQTPDTGPVNGPGATPSSAGPSAKLPGDVLRTRAGVRIPENTSLDLDTDSPGWPVQATEYDPASTDIYVYRTNSISTHYTSKIGYFGLTPPTYQECSALTT